MGAQSSIARTERMWFWAIMAAAVVLRISAFNSYSAHAPDELIQYLEQAHRIVFGYGVVPWEFREFIRSWLIPLMLVPPMQFGEWLDPGGPLYLVLPRAMVAVIEFRASRRSLGDRSADFAAACHRRHGGRRPVGRVRRLFRSRR